MKYQKKIGMSLFEQENTMESLSKMDNSIVEDTLPHRTCLRFHGTEHERTFFQGSGNLEGCILHRIHQFGL